VIRFSYGTVWNGRNFWVKFLHVWDFKRKKTRSSQKIWPNFT
jgi:hypothetical protein